MNDSVKLDEGQLAKLRALARKRRVTFQALVFRVIQAGLKKELSKERGESSGQDASCLELATASGFVGAGEDLPPDLSTNPEHLSGFGRD